MPHQESEPHREPGAIPVQRVQRDRTMHTSPRTAIWNALTALAIIAILFVTFYGLTAQRDPSGGAEGPATTAAAPTPSQTTPPQTTGQGGSQNEAAPKGEGAR